MVFWILLWSKSHGEQFSQVERSGIDAEHIQYLQYWENLTILFFTLYDKFAFKSALYQAKPSNPVRVS